MPHIFPKLKVHLVSDLDLSAKDISVIQNPFYCKIEQIAPGIQLEIIELQTV